MRTVYSFIILSLLVAGVWLSPSQAGAAVCQNKTAIVYSNGMFNTKRAARDSLNDGLQYRLVESSPAFADPNAYEYHLAYASDKDGLGSTFKDQLLEAAYQWRSDLLSSFWRWLGGIEAAPQWLQDMMVNMAGALDALTYVVDADHQKQLNGGNGFSGYRALLNDGKRVVIVSHSQGNFYANRAYDALIAEDAAWANGLGITAVATPASRVGGDGPHLTLNEDCIITPIPGSLPSTPALGSSDNIVELGAAVWANAWFGHNFVQWYLAGTFSRDIILNNIVATIAAMPSTTTISVADSSVTEGSGGGVANLHFSVTMCSASTSDVTVNYATSDVTANSGSDYTAASGVLTIPAGSTIGTIAVAVTGDTVFEPDETLMLTLSNPVNAILGTAMATGTILDDDRSSPYYYRDDWVVGFGIAGRYRNIHSHPTQYKFMRDDQRGLAYAVDVGQNSVFITITDYINNESETLPTYFMSPFVGSNGYSIVPPKDVLLWSKGIVFLYYTSVSPELFTLRRLTISDAGVGSSPRWTIDFVDEVGTAYPSYETIIWINDGQGNYHYEPYSRNWWAPVETIAYRISGYSYKMPMIAGAKWLNHPVGTISSYDAAPMSQRLLGATDEYYYGALEISDGEVSFNFIGGAIVYTGNGVSQISPKPVMDFGLGSSMAYTRSQSFLKAYRGGVLPWAGRAELPNGDLLLAAGTSIRPSSLSNDMAY